MAALVTSKRTNRIARLRYEAIEVVGSLLPTHVIASVGSGEATEQDDASYGVPKGRTLRDEIARYYQIASAHWRDFESTRRSRADASILFVQRLLRECFGFTAFELSDPKRVSGRLFPINLVAEGGRVPLVVAPCFSDESRKAGIDRVSSEFGDNSRRRSATQLLQEYLNAEEQVLWGMASDGAFLRIMRDNPMLTRPAWIEVDLEKIFAEHLFADFSAVWLLMHSSRFGPQGASLSDCPLERWKQKSFADGVVAKEKLRDGVEEALAVLGRGFLQNRSNSDLRKRIELGDVSDQDYYEDLLRLVYRIIFLFVAEDRNLLHTPSAPRYAQDAYMRGYSISRLRDRCLHGMSYDHNSDLWEGAKTLFRALATDQPALGLVALGGLFDTKKLTILMESGIENSHFLTAIRCIAWCFNDGQLTRVNWRDMETEELGSVYESLLELTPHLKLGKRDFTFDQRGSTRGNKRKTTGSYYTPDTLVQLVLDMTLDPALDRAVARNPTDPVSEILKLSIIDPACGSGHFLLGAARRVALRIAHHRHPEAINREAVQRAVRDVVTNCIYGVDRNPMAVELCKVALWIEALEPGKPLSYLDSQVRCGDSLIGLFDLSVLRVGIPDAAYSIKTGDDKTVAKALRAHNRSVRKSKFTASLFASATVPEQIAEKAKKIAELPEDTLTQVAKKAREFSRYQQSEQWQRLNRACDLYVMAFLARKNNDKGSDTLIPETVPTTDDVWRVLRGEEISTKLRNACRQTATKHRVFHWTMAYPAVMMNGGFDIVIGNPPWEVSKLVEEEYFANRDDEIARSKGSKRKAKIQNLKKQNPELWDSFNSAKRDIKVGNSFFKIQDDLIELAPEL